VAHHSGIEGKKVSDTVTLIKEKGGLPESKSGGTGSGVEKKEPEEAGENY